MRASVCRRTLWRSGLSLSVLMLAAALALLVSPLGRSLAAGTLDQSQTNQNLAGGAVALPIEVGRSSTIPRTIGRRGVAYCSGISNQPG